MATALSTLMSLPAVPLAPHATPIEWLGRLATALGPKAPRLFIKRDDLIAFGMGGNKVRKIQAVLAEAATAGADVLITCGGLQSNHCRVTAAAGAVQGLRVILVVNGEPPAVLSGNLLLDRLFGAEVRHVATREERDPMMAKVADEVRAAGGTPFVIPLGASTATGALGFARGVGEIAAGGLKPDVIIAPTSSGGTQAGLVAGCALFGVRARVLGVSADASAAAIDSMVSLLLAQMAARLGASMETVGAQRRIRVDADYVGEGYGKPTPESTEALELVARHEGIVLDPVYTAKAMACLIARVRAGEFKKDDTVLFWHTGGQVMTTAGQA